MEDHGARVDRRVLLETLLDASGNNAAEHGMLEVGAPGVALSTWFCEVSLFGAPCVVGCPELACFRLHEVCGLGSCVWRQSWSYSQSSVEVPREMNHKPKLHNS